MDTQQTVESPSPQDMSNVARAKVEELQKDWDNLFTDTTYAQRDCEEKCAYYLIPFFELDDKEREKFIASGLTDVEGEYQFLHAKHVKYLHSLSGHLGPEFSSQASSRPWLLYHVLNSLSLLGEEPQIDREGAIQSLNNCRTAYGGYAGSSTEFPHTMTTYAAINSLIYLEAYDHIDRGSLYEFYLSMKQPDNSFSVHFNGESDCRSTYCVLSICRLLHILTPELTSGVKEYLLSCQTYEGGFGSNPHTEAHGGYTFCAVAALSILGGLHECDLSSLERWLYARQGDMEGGFNGRTNKLVDGCYSWYVGSSIRMVSQLRNPSSPPLWNLDKLMQYAFRMEQHPQGGLRDKPEMRSDPYHTMYCLCGLSVAGGGGVLRNEIDPVHCVEKTIVQKCIEHFSAYQEDHVSILSALSPCVVECIEGAVSRELCVCFPINLRLTPAYSFFE